MISKRNVIGLKYFGNNIKRHKNNGTLLYDSLFDRQVPTFRLKFLPLSSVQNANYTASPLIRQWS